MARLIDSSVFIDLERRGGTIGDLDAILLGEPFALASITASELLVGVHRADAGRRRGRSSADIYEIEKVTPSLGSRHSHCMDSTKRKDGM